MFIRLHKLYSCIKESLAWLFSINIQRVPEKSRHRKIIIHMVLYNKAFQTKFPTNGSYCHAVYLSFAENSNDFHYEDMASNVNVHAEPWFFLQFFRWVVDGPHTKQWQKVEVYVWSHNLKTIHEINSFLWQVIAKSCGIYIWIKQPSLK